MDANSLQDLARYQRWADGEHWKAIHANPALEGDAEVRKRLNHMAAACRMLAGLARGEVPDRALFEERESLEEIEAAMREATEGAERTIATVDLEEMVKLPRGPQGPFEAPAGALLLQALMHGQHHRAQNASRMRELGVTPPMTDYILWVAFGRP